MGPKTEGVQTGECESLDTFAVPDSRTPERSLPSTKVARPLPPAVGVLGSSKETKVPPPVGMLRVVGQKPEARHQGKSETLVTFGGGTSISGGRTPRRCPNLRTSLAAFAADDSDRLEREAIQAAESAEAMWAELATMPPNVLKDRASRTDDPETKRRLLALAQRKPVVVQVGVNDEDGDRREAGFSRKS